MHGNRRWATSVPRNLGSKDNAAPDERDVAGAARFRVEASSVPMNGSTRHGGSFEHRPGDGGRLTAGEEPASGTGNQWDADAEEGE